MTVKSLWIVILTLALIPPGMAADSGSPSRAPDRPLAQPSDYDLGVKAVRAGDYQRALGSLQKAVQANPRNADAWNFIGFSQRKLRHFDESLAAYRKALAINPDHRGANEYLGELYLTTGDVDGARERLSKLQSLCPAGCSEYDDLKKAVDAYQPARNKT